ncbi:MAG: hypothetical protein U9N31_05430 [Candidatus Marinimicrobia bacterium]|nr:hypothetical protein [Candidatus Neomarinimicrobiota bacterium]
MGSAVSREHGVTQAQLENIHQYESSELFSTVEKAALRYADAMTATPAEVPDEVFQQVKEHFNDEQIVELTSTIAWENYRARFDHALKIESQEFTAGAFCPLPIKDRYANRKF